jgi:TetR/AcrR family transcriptional regulator, copper-responsive repressor
MVNAEPKRRGRPRAYDPDAALKRARDRFWRTGYAATSLDDLAAAMGMNRPSIYAGFGDKRALYAAAVERYAAESRSGLARELATPRPLREGLLAVYRGAAAIYRAGGEPPRGCFLVGTAVTEATRDEHVRRTVDATFDAFTALFAERFTRAAHDGELSEAATPAALAQIATAALNTIALRCRTGAKAEVIDALIDATVDVICG